MKEIHPDQRYLDLAEKWLNGTITQKEEEEYADWYNTIDPDTVLEIPSHVASDREQYRIKMLQQIRSKRVPVIFIKKHLVLRLAAAAMLVIIIGSAYLVFNRTTLPSVVKTINPKSKVIKNDALPGTSGAVLTMNHGEAIVLDTVKNGKIISAHGTHVTKVDGGLTFRNITSQSNTIEQYTLTTPRARYQTLTLPDGTIVWLNAQSSISFPSAFTGSKREIEVTGEAYFEVAKDASKPFIVQVNESKIEVLGTHFNVMAYSNEKAIETTLMEGSIKFSKGHNSILLKPGQQSQLLADSKIRLENNVDVDQVVAWKNGMQSFTSADIQTIMRQIERWYDVDVEFKGNVPGRTFTGSIPRNAKLSELLKLFEVNKIHFQIDGEQKKLIITP